MPNSQIHDVLVIIDTETILRKYPPRLGIEPTEVTDPKGLVTFAGPGITGDSDLRLDGAVLDVLRLRERSILLNIRTAALFYDFDIDPRAELITRPEPIVYSCLAPTLGRDRRKPGVQRLDQHLWQSTVIQTGYTTSKFSFMIFKEGPNQELKTIGEYFWRFTIDIGYNGEEEQ